MHTCIYMYGTYGCGNFEDKCMTYACAMRELVCNVRHAQPPYIGAHSQRVVYFALVLS